ncbi:MAG TPA: Cof-type HAD-IIB family hydrolase [Verrucomicrobiae bacterium]|nr:Cof-type HAD-IIB family hydrolase [Verrucomicrobiae bacterium]
MPSIRLVALDLDGTLLDSSEGISLANRAAIKHAQALGLHIVIITGRGADAPLAFGRELGLTDPIICAHGALTKDCPSGRERRHIAIPREYATALIEFAQAHGLDTAVYTGEHFHRIAGARRHMEDMVGPLWVDVPDLIPLAERDSTFIRFFGHDAVDAISSHFAGLPVHFKFETWGNFEELAITSEEATKERALAQLCDDLSISAKEVIAVGDSRNDVPMLRWAGIGVAMGNALPEVIDAAPYVTAGNDDDGVARALERFVFDPREGERRSA